MARVFIGLGSNEGERLDHVSRAVRRLARTEGIRVVQMAPVYATEPVEGPPQPDFLNSVVEIETAIPPAELLRLLKAMERESGRKPSTERWGPRVIDLDILMYGDQVVAEPDLTIPHAHMHARRFVLEPLAQLDPALRHPVLGRTVSELLADLAGKQAVEPHRCA